MKIWCRDFRDENYTDAAMRDVTRFRGIAFMHGRRVGDRFPHGATIDIRSRTKPTDFFMAGPFPVVSSKLKCILDGFSVQGEYMPVVLVHINGQPVDGTWHCFNATEVADCFDRERSLFTPEQDYATEIKQLVIREDACGAAPLVLAAKTIPHLIVVQDDVYKAILSGGCTGVVLKDAAEWRDPVNPV